MRVHDECVLELLWAHADAVILHNDPKLHFFADALANRLHACRHDDTPVGRELTGVTNDIQTHAQQLLSVNHAHDIFGIGTEVCVERRVTVDERAGHDCNRAAQNIHRQRRRVLVRHVAAADVLDVKDVVHDSSQQRRAPLKRRQRRPDFLRLVLHGVAQQLDAALNRVQRRAQVVRHVEEQPRERLLNSAFVALQNSEPDGSDENDDAGGPRDGDVALWHALIEGVRRNDI
mmetsp:Transcript_15185/g.52754  ORF Transcript_15185/g.52754 Transcript_15185/m.52754 type:complete len:232 (+) Transcript_15185:976-1671(+)